MDIDSCRRDFFACKCIYPSTHGWTSLRHRSLALAVDEKCGLSELEGAWRAAGVAGSKNGGQKIGEGNRREREWWIELHRTLCKTPARKLTPGTRGGAYAGITRRFVFVIHFVDVASVMCVRRRRGTCRLIKASVSSLPASPTGKSAAPSKGRKKEERQLF